MYPLAENYCMKLLNSHKICFQLHINQNDCDNYKQVDSKSAPSLHQVKNNCINHVTYKAEKAACLTVSKDPSVL